MWQQRPRSRADWLVRGSSLVFVTLFMWFTPSSKAKGTPHTTPQKTVMTSVGGWGGGGGLAWCGQCSTSYRADGRVAISASYRPEYYFTQNEYTKDLERNGVHCSDAIRMVNATRHSPRNCAYSQLSLSWKRFYLCGLCLDGATKSPSRIVILPTVSQHKHMIYTNCCIYRVVPLDDEQ